jgi:serine/threonine protein kinase/tetratricopeptide (TPR) repeat protein
MAEGSSASVKVGTCETRLAIFGPLRHIESHPPPGSFVTSADSPLANALIGRYTIERQLGQGGMATVYLAQDLKHKRPVALKVLHPELTAALGPERFLREVETTARLDHPHILPVFDSGEAQGLLWYTMPYVEGESLRERLRREGQLPIDDALRIAREVAEALDCAHRHAIVHRDIKPENILLAEGHARVADFGVARALEMGDRGKLTETGMAVGTPAYMSPEQATGGRVDARTDVYALGCVLYEMLAGEPPFTGPSPQAVIAKRLSGEVPSLLRVRPAIPGELAHSVAKALAPLAADRFQTAREFAQALTAGHLSKSASETVTAAHKREPRSSVRLGLAVALSLLLTVVVGILFWQWSRGTEGPAAAAPPKGVQAVPSSPEFSFSPQPSVAVLPLTNLSPDRANEYFSDGMTEELITALGRVKGLRVAARASSFAFKGRPLDIGEASRKLHVGAVLDGSVRRAGNRLRVTAELVDARDGSRLWADQYDRQLKNVFAVQDELARAIVGALRIPLKLASSSDTALVKPATADVDAHDLYLQGRFLWNQRTREALLRAAQYFERAVGRDSAYAQAYAGLADTYVVLPYFGAVRPTKAFATAKRAAERALALDSTLAEAHTSLAEVRMIGDYDWPGAEEEYRRAIALDPNYATAHQWYANYLGAVGRLDEAVAEAERAHALDPLSRVIAIDLVNQLMATHHYDDALRELRTILELDPNYALTHDGLCSLYLVRRAPRQAVAECERAEGLVASDRGAGRLAYAYAAAGDRARAAAILGELEARRRRAYVRPTAIAMAHLGLGDTATAFAWLDSAVAEHDPGVIYLSGGPLWDPMHGERFARLRTRMGLPP